MRKFNPMEVKQEPSDFSEEYMIQQESIEFSHIEFPDTVKHEISEDLLNADLANTDTNNYFADSNTLEKVRTDVGVDDIKLEEEEDKAEKVTVQNGIVQKDEIQEEFNKYEQIHIENQLFLEDFSKEPRGAYYSGSRLTKVSVGTPDVGRPSSASPGEIPLTAKRKKQSVPVEDKRFDNTAHWPILVDGHEQRCKLEFCKGRSRTHCEKCKVFLCYNKKNNCFKKYHVK
ncbi:uncharacterized protein LOC126880601 isoform X3 [Diabrotica virgifera virgifera]|uniref:Uncharacterized protein LOC114335093 isoform X3 n=1 Tax=Diabrotica virgifera virgifera TaxID=50390 RepID=A0A6P7G985_DIAVI|nr:uncharacterized protein LOC126880601 isoform X3 [Diabrotica virgifera virgifera]